MRIAEAEVKITEVLVGRSAAVDTVSTKEGTAPGTLLVTFDSGETVEVEIRHPVPETGITVCGECKRVMLQSNPVHECHPDPVGEQAAADGELFPLQMNFTEVE